MLKEFIFIYNLIELSHRFRTDEQNLETIFQWIFLRFNFNSVGFRFHILVKLAKTCIIIYS